MLPSADVDPREGACSWPSFMILRLQQKQKLEAGIGAQCPNAPLLLPACPGYSWAMTAWLLLPLCLSPPILFTAPFPLVSTDRSTKCFPSLPAIFIPFIRVISFVNSFLAQGRQPSSVPASAVGTGRVWAPIKGGKSRAALGLAGLGDCSCSGDGSRGDGRSFIPSPLLGLFEQAACAQGLGNTQLAAGSQNRLKIGSISFSSGLFMPAEGEHFCSQIHIYFTIRQTLHIPAVKSSHMPFTASQLCSQVLSQHFLLWL